MTSNKSGGDSLQFAALIPQQEETSGFTRSCDLTEPAANSFVQG